MTLKQPKQKKLMIKQSDARRHHQGRYLLPKENSTVSSKVPQTKISARASETLEDRRASADPDFIDSQRLGK